MRFRMIVAVVPLLCMSMIAVPVHAASIRNTSALSITANSILINTGPEDVCDGGSANQCLQDPSDGGAGTPVEMSVFGTNDARQWTVSEDKTTPDACGGTVHGDCPSENLNDHYHGDPIVTIKNVGSQLCIGANAATQYKVQMKTCDDPSTLFIDSVNSCTGFPLCYVVGVDDSVANKTTAWLCGSDTPDAQPIVTSNCNPKDLATWEAET